MTPALNIGDFAYLSLVEIITLQKLLLHQDPVVRFILYQEVDQVVNPKLTYKLSAENLLANSLKSSDDSKKELSTSSFYSNLRSLEKKGLVSFIKDKKDKIEAVKATERVREALMTIFRSLLILLIDDYEYLVSLAEELIKKIGVNHFETLLTVNLTEEVDLKLLSFYNQIADQVYFLADEEVFQNMIKMGFNKLEYTRMINKVIREPNNFFDAAIVPDYEKEPNFYGFSRIDLIKELHRVVKDGGVVILVGRAKIPEHQNFYANVLLNAFSDAVKGRIFTKKEVEEDLKTAGFEKLEIFEFHGLILGLGWV